VTVPTQNYVGYFNGLTFGPGTNVQLLSIDNGLRGIPSLRSGDVPKPRQDGVNAGLDFLGPRVFTITLQPFNPAVLFETVVSQVMTAFQVISDPALQLPFQLFLPNWVEARQITCRPTNAGLPIDQQFQFNISTIPIQLTASDPLVYSTTLHTASTTLPSPTAGLTFPVTFPVTFGASTGGSMSVTNSGNYITAPVFTITGPVTNPSVIFTATGQFMKLNITLSNTDVLVIDMGARTVLLNGTAYRFNTVATGSSWWGIPVGSWSIGVASTDATAVAAVFTVAYRDAWGSF
jgi:hypothetical protein